MTVVMRERERSRSRKKRFDSGRKPMLPFCEQNAPAIREENILSEFTLPADAAKEKQGVLSSTDSYHL